MSQLRIANPQRRDRLLLVNALAIHLLTLLCTAGESLGFDRLLKSNTSKRRTHSLFRQGCMLYELVMAPSPQELGLRQPGAVQTGRSSASDFLSSRPCRGGSRRSHRAPLNRAAVPASMVPTCLRNRLVVAAPRMKSTSFDRHRSITSGKG